MLGLHVNCTRVYFITLIACVDAPVRTSEQNPMSLSTSLSSLINATCSDVLIDLCSD